jgi:hypothetical protein
MLLGGEGPRMPVAEMIFAYPQWVGNGHDQMCEKGKQTYALAPDCWFSLILPVSGCLGRPSSRYFRSLWRCLFGRRFFPLNQVTSATFTRSSNCIPGTQYLFVISGTRFTAWLPPREGPARRLLKARDKRTISPWTPSALIGFDRVFRLDRQGQRSITPPDKPPPA